MIDVLVLPGPHAAALAERLRVAAPAARFDVRVAEAAADIAPAADRDVVLVLGPVEIAPGTLERLADCAAREPGVATVSAFSNRAVYAGYPAAEGAHAPAEGETVASLGEAFARVNGGETVDLPAPDGPIVYVLRAGLAQAGPLDAAALAAFARRAREAGLRHLLCGEAYVFDARRDAPPPAPDTADVRAFRERDPARPLRRRVDLARLAASPRPRLLLVTHRWGGGIERHVRDVARIAGEVAEVLLLRPDGPHAVELSWMREGERFQAWFTASQWDALLAVLRGVGISRLHYHHIHQLPRAVLDLPGALGAPYDVTLHDYYPVCPQYHLTPAPGEYCGGSPARCERCVETRPAPWGLTLEQWRATFHAFLRGAARVIAPSHDCAARIQRYFPDVAVREWPHPESPQRPPEVHKVVLLGGVSGIKGARVLEACVADARERGLALHFHVIGHVDRPMASWPAAPLTVGGSYAEEDLPMLIALERSDAILFLPQVAETYSYTLSAAMATGLPILSLAVGAFPERLRGYRPHALLARETPAASINEALLALVRRAVEPAPRAAMADSR